MASPGRRVLFFKAHIEGYTKRDGTFVTAHEDKRPAARAWYHGTTHPFDGPLNLDRYGEGAFADAGLSATDRSAAGYIPAIYLADDRRHAEQYGSHVIEADIDESKAVKINAAKQLAAWARSWGIDRHKP